MYIPGGADHFFFFLINDIQELIAGIPLIADFKLLFFIHIYITTGIVKSTRGIVILTK